jgi:hypothetical protein
MRDTGHGNVPVPDPTLLTTQQLMREMDNIDRIFTTRLDAMDTAVKLAREDITRVPTELDKQIKQLSELIFQRILYVDKQFVERDIRTAGLAQAHQGALDSSLTATKDALNERTKTFELEIEKVYESFQTVQATTEVQFRGIQTQFQERDVRTTLATTSAQTAVGAALQAQKEAAGEQNRSLSLSIDKSEAGTQSRLTQQGEQISTVERTLNDKIAVLSSRVDRAEGTGTGRGQIATPVVNHISTVLAAVVVAIVTTMIVSWSNKAPQPSTTIVEQASPGSQSQPPPKR